MSYVIGVLIGVGVVLAKANIVAAFPKQHQDRVEHILTAIAMITAVVALIVVVSP